MRKYVFLVFFACSAILCAQDNGKWSLVREHQQKSFANTIPSGNYSGITPLGDDVYAMVSDKSDSALYFNVRLYISKQTGELLQAEYLGPQGRVDTISLDNEAIARVSDSTVVIASEGKYRLKEYMLNSDNVDQGLWNWSMPRSDFYPNYVFESAAYDSVHHRLWTINESTMLRDGKPATTQDPHNNVLRLISFDWTNKCNASPVSYLYKMDMPTTMKRAMTYVMGVSELCVLPDGKLLVLEREAFIPHIKLGAFCQCKLYVVDPYIETPYAFDKELEPGAPYVTKHLLTSWRTKLGITKYLWANYEGMCLGPKLENGDQVVVLVSDSQDGYAGVLKDWFKTIVIKKQ